MVWTRIPRYMAEYANGGLHNQKRRYSRKERKRETLHASIVLVLKALCHKDLGAVECERYHSTVCIIHEIVLARGAPALWRIKRCNHRFLSTVPPVHCALCIVHVHVHMRMPMCFLGI